MALGCLGTDLHGQGEFTAARDLHQQALDLHRELGNRGDEAAASNGLGEAAAALGDPAGAAGQHAAALDLAVELGDRMEAARAHHGLARACAGLGDPAQARDHARQALAGYAELRLPEPADLIRLSQGDQHSPVR